MDEVSFLSRLYDLESLPSTDRRFKSASGDIRQHRQNNDDWEDDWIFSDSRFQLAAGPDEVLLGFLAQMVHPVVQPDTTRAAQIVEELNRHLSPDGWALKPQKRMSGRPVYAPVRIGSQGAIVFAHETAARLDTEYISQQVTRMEASIETAPDLAIGTAKEFIESICKTILEERNESYDKNDNLVSLVRKTTKILQLTPDDVAANTRAADTIKRMLMNLATLVQGSAELRNSHGSGHGRSASQTRHRLTPRHARLAVGSAATLGVFLYETHEERP